MFIAVSAALAGCAATPVAPKPVPTIAATSITFPLVTDNWEEGTAQLATKDKRGCGVFSQDIFPTSGDSDFTVAIEGNKDIFFHLTRSNSTNKCDFVRMFYATQGNKYLLNIDMQNQTCKISLKEETPDGNQNEMNTYPAYVSQVDGVSVCEIKDKLYN